MGDRPPHLRRNRPAPSPETDPGRRKPELSGDLPETAPVGDDGEMGSHDDGRVRDALSEVKCDLHTEPRYPRRMSDVANRLKIARERAGYATAKAAAEAMGVSRYTYAQHENGTRGFPAGTAQRYAKFFKVSSSWLLYGSGDEPTQQDQILSTPLTPISRYVPVIGEVQAGAWSVIPVTQPEPDEFVPVHLPAFERAQLFALRVVGESMNLVFRSGTRVVVCPTFEIGLRENTYVVVRRQRGGEVETTVKEVVREPGGDIMLYPRSSHPDHQEPIRLTASRDSDEGVEIIGVVVAEFNVMPMPTTPLLRI